MEHKVNDSLTITIKDYKPYSVSKAIKLAMLGGVKVKDGENPEISAENVVASEEALIFGMTNLTPEQLNDLREEEVDFILEAINKISNKTAPTQTSGSK